MPLFTGTPESLQASPLLVNYNGGVGRVISGARVSGSNIYYPAYQSAGADATRIFMMRRAVSGGSWSAVDQSNSPAIGGAGLQAGSSKPMIWDPANSLMHFLGRFSASPFNLVHYYFDVSSGLWFPTLIDAGGTATSITYKGAMRSDGSLFVAYQKTTASSNVYYRIFSGGSWGSEILLDSGGSQNFPQGIVVDNSDTAHIIYTHQTAGPTSVLNYITVTSGGVIGTPVTIDTDTGQTNLHDMMIWNGRIIFTRISTSGATVSIVVGTPVASPSWSTLTVATTSNSGSAPQVAASPSGTSVYLVWDKNVYGGSPAQSLQYRTWDGSSFGAENVLWDIQANPLPGAESVPTSDNFVDEPILSIEGGKLRVVARTTANIAEDFGDAYIEVSLAGGSSYINRMYIEPN